MNDPHHGPPQHHGPPGHRGPPPGERKHFFDSRRNADLFFRAFYVLCAVVFVAELFIDRHTEHPWEGLFGFYGLWGFASFWFLVLVAKQMRKVLIRSEDYYDVD
jgi:hypothetical protein